MKKEKMSPKLFYVASLLFYLAAFIGFLGENDDSNAAVWLCLGSAFLCLGTVYAKKVTKDEDDKTKE